MTCGLRENRKGKLRPPCKQSLDSRGKCRVHCRAKLRGARAGKLCVNRHVKGKRRCRMHGGKTPAALKSKILKTGEYSRYLPVLSPSMKKRFENAMRQGDVLSLLPDIFMIDARIEEIISRDTVARVNALAVLSELTLAVASDDEAAQANATLRLRAILENGADSGDWDEVKDLLKQRTRMVESERNNKLRDSVHKSVALQLVDALVRAVERNIEDPVMRQRVADEVMRLIGAIAPVETGPEELGEIG